MACSRSLMWIRAVALLLVFAACRTGSEVYQIDRLESGYGGSGLSSALGLTPDGFRRLVAEAVSRQVGFRYGGGAESAAPRFTLGVRLEDLALESAEPTPHAEALVTVWARPRREDTARYDAVAKARAELPGDSLDERQGAARLATELAISRGLVDVRAQLVARARSDVQLKRDLRSSDEAVRWAAIRALTERGSPEAVEPLIRRLSSSEADEIRRALGGLVQLRAHRAVPAIIELAKSKEGILLNELLFALSAIGGDEAEAYLFTVAQGHDSPDVQALAQRALEEMQARERRGEGRGDAR